jgi:colanic acid/amylovoran biosynthesis glycosyltransferase
MKRQKKIALITANVSIYSETFIKAQIDLLPATLVLHKGWLPQMTGDKYLLNDFKRYINYIIKPVFIKGLFSLEGAIIKSLRRNKIDVVLAQYGPAGVAMIDICDRIGIPLFVHFHGYDASHKAILSEYAYQYKELFERAEGIIAVSKKMEEALVNLGCPPHKITVIHYGPNDDFFNINPNYKNPTFFGVGRFVDKKSPYLTLLAFKEVLDKYNDSRLIIGGDGDLLNACKNIAKAYGIENNVYFPGVLKPEETMKLMESSLAFVQHSVIADNGDSEGTPVAVLEASAAALPVIATWHAGIPDVIINGETGILVNEFDIKAMTVAMIKLIEDNDLAKRMGLAGRERIKNQFSMDGYISKLGNLINGSSN